MMLNAWSSGKKPWSFPEVTDMVRNTIELRSKLLPYLYTAFYAYEQQGIPPFRAMVLEQGYRAQETQSGGTLDDASNPYAEEERIEVTDQYMMGPSLLVAPVFAGQNERSIVLPRGNWYDFYTGEYAGNGETITIQTKLEQIPLLVKDGGIIPLLASVSKEEADQSLEVRHYGKQASSYVLYNDDGISYDYEQGAYSLTELTAKAKKNGKWSGSERALGSERFTYGRISWRWMTE
jgi:alpha-D-xyloside xylohydrolase